MRSRLSPTLVWKWRVDARPAPAARRSTTSWCRRSGRAAARCRRPRPRSASRLLRSRAGVVARLPSAHGTGRPVHERSAPTATHRTTPVTSQPGGVRRRRGGQPAAQPTATVLHDRLDLGPEAGRHGEAPPRPVRAERRDGDLAHGDQRHRQPPEAARRPRAPTWPRARAPCRPAGRGRRPSGWCPGGGRASRRRRRWRPARSTARAPATTAPMTTISASSSGDEDQPADGDGVGRRGERRRARRRSPRAVRPAQPGAVEVGAGGAGDRAPWPATPDRQRRRAR